MYWFLGSTGYLRKLYTQNIIDNVLDEFEDFESSLKRRRTLWSMMLTRQPRWKK